MVGDGDRGAYRGFIFEYSAAVVSCGLGISSRIFVLVGGMVLGTVASSTTVFVYEILLGT